MTKLSREIEEQLYDPGGKELSTNPWMIFVNQHKDLRTAKGLLDLKAISKLWKQTKAKSYDPAPKKQCEPSICKAIEAKGEDCDKYDIPELIDSTLSCEQNKKNILKELNLRKTDKYSKYAQQAKRHYAGTGKLRGASPAERAAAFAQMRQDGTLRGYDPAHRKSGILNTPGKWFKAMVAGIKRSSDVKDPAAIVKRIWSRLPEKHRSSIQAKEAKGESFKYNLPLPDDKKTKGTGTLRMVKPFNLTEVQVNLNNKDYLAALKSGLFEKMKRQDGSTALVSRCKSKKGNCNIFVDKVMS